MCSLKTVLFFTTIIALSQGYKILGIFTVPSGSHNILARKLFSELAKSGHEVTFITPYAQNNPVKNLKEIPLEGLQTVFQAKGQSMFDREKQSPLEKAIFINNIQYDFSKYLLAHEKTQKLLNSDQHYDAVIVYYYMNDALLTIAHHFKAPLILFASMPLYSSESFLLSHPTPSSYVPNILTEYTGRMNFWQRLRNAYYDITMILYYQWVMLPKQRQLVQEYIPSKPELYNLLNNESLILINSHVSTNEATPVVPNAIEIGGFHLEEPKPLPEDIKKFLDSSTNGAILFSMGSISQSADFPKEKRDALIKTFSKLKENVLWKFEKDIEGLPKNVKTMKWIPQSDVLAHPNVKLFISHGGLLSTMESVYHGVPIVGIPLHGDQKMNMALAANYEYAVEVPYSQLNEETISQAVNEVLRNPKYRNNIEKRSKIMRDRPIKPLDNALYWIEYVIRHQGAPHLRYPGADLRWYQRNLLDVVAFVMVVTLVPIYALIVILRRFLGKNTQKYKKA